MVSHENSFYYMSIVDGEVGAISTHLPGLMHRAYGRIECQLWKQALISQQKFTPM